MFVAYRYNWSLQTARLNLDTLDYEEKEEELVKDLIKQLGKNPVRQLGKNTVIQLGKNFRVLIKWLEIVILCNNWIM